MVFDPRLAIDQAELEERYRFLQEVNGLRASLQAGASRGSAVLTKLDPVKEYLVSTENTATIELLESTRTRIEEARKPIALEGSSFRNPSLASRAGGLFGELEGSEVQQGTLRGPTPVQRERLRLLLGGRCRRRFKRWRERFETSLAELNAKLATLGPMRVVK